MSADALPTGAITKLAELEALYGTPSHASLAKVTARLTDPQKRVIEAAPFCVLATLGPRGIDCSPRGDAPGFVHIEDDRHLILPDRRGNNRIDTLRNVVANGFVGLIFLVPGWPEALRLAGTGRVIADEKTCARFAVNGQAPRTVLRIEIASAFQQCARAVMRSGLWEPSIPRTDLPTAGQLTRAADPSFDAESYDATLRERQKSTLY